MTLQNLLKTGQLEAFEPERNRVAAVLSWAKSLSDACLG